LIPVKPGSISDSAGDVTVTVTMHRESDPGGVGPLRFWRMRYPETITSRATAHYEGAEVSLWPKDRARAWLKRGSIL
jgi:hypothetical protein